SACHQARDLKQLHSRLSGTWMRIQSIADAYDPKLMSWLKIPTERWEQRAGVETMLQRLGDCIDDFKKSPLGFVMDDSFKEVVLNSMDLINLWRMPAIEDVLRTVRVQIKNSKGRHIAPVINDQWALSFDAPITSLSIITGINPPAEDILCFNY